MRKLRGLKKAVVTVLDGTGKLHLARKLFGDRLVETNIGFERLAYVKGSKGKSYSKTSITAEDRDGNIIRFKEQPAAQLRGDIAKIYDRLSPPWASKPGYAVPGSSPGASDSPKFPF